jgi:succinate dehydrogenase flavin-adding protein (antitoxin of CptAB toxin-antitoxin module)
MLELDHLLTQWLDTHYAASDEQEKAAFRALLELPDDDLAGYLLGSKPVIPEGFDAIVRRVRGGTST